MKNGFLNIGISDQDVSVLTTNRIKRNEVTRPVLEYNPLQCPTTDNRVPDLEKSKGRKYTLRGGEWFVSSTLISG